MARKRAPGAGRPPQGEYPNRTAQFTMRMSKETRAGLEREAKRSGRSLSQEAEHRLRQSLKFPEKLYRDWGGEHHYGFGRLIAHAAQGIEMSTGKRWRDDAFAARALLAALPIIMDRLMPDEPPQTPEAVKRSVDASARFVPVEQAAFYSTPEGVGASVAGGLVHSLDIHDDPPLNHPSNVYYDSMFYTMPHIRKALGLTKKEGKP